jgi:hypothetical protein
VQPAYPVAVPAVGQIAGRHGGLRRQTGVDQLGSGPEMQRQEKLSEAYLKVLAVATEEYREAAHLPAVVAEAAVPALSLVVAAQDVLREATAVPDVPLAVAKAAQDVLREATAVPDVPLAVAEAAQDVLREATGVPDVPLVVAEAAQDVLREAAGVPDVPRVVAEAAQDVLREATGVPDVPLVVAEATQDVLREAAGVPDVPLVVAEAAQDVLREAAGVPDVPLVVAEAAQDVLREAAGVLDVPLAEPPLVAPRVSLLAVGLARQQVALPLHEPVVTINKGSKSQSLREGLSEFVSLPPQRVR